ncbi:MAG: CHAT domain-containing protein [Deltaproteobacteria bacterium]|nr:CHAT domain-containing protein [Deltaproteobacteria bacterium]
MAAAVGLILAGCFAQGPAWSPPPPAPRPESAGLARPDRVAFFPSDELAPSASSSGRYLAFVSDETGNLDVWLKDFLSDTTFPLTTDAADDTDPSFGRLSDRLLIVSRRFDAKGDLFLMDVDGGSPTRLTDEATADRQPVFSPDERTVYFTASSPIGFEFVASIDLDDHQVQRLSPTPGFDPAPSPDGRYLVYTAAGDGARVLPHLVAIRLSDSSTRAITDGETPAGFARFVRTASATSELVYVRFADDDNDDGAVDGTDQASLWSISLDLDGLFAGAPRARSQPFPLTAGNRDELFPEPSDGWLYFTETARLDQDVVRIPLRGMFPRYADPAEYLRLADTLLDDRERWFALRALLARTERESVLHARALLGIANLHLEAKRWRLARAALEELALAARDAEERSERAELLGLAEVELTSLDRRAQIARAATPAMRERALRAIQGDLEDRAERFDWSARAAARVDLELAELVFDRGDRLGAIAAFDGVLARHGDQAYSAARAMIRRTELLRVAHDPDGLAEAYGDVLRRFPEQRALVGEAAERIVEAQLEAADRGAAARIDALRRVLMRTASAPVRFVARRKLADLFLEGERPELAAAELEQLVQEARGAEQELTASSALADLARVEEDRGALDQALERWSELRREHGELPGVGAAVRDAITRVALKKAATAERAGQVAGARDAYRAVLANDPTQVRAIRRYLALMAATGESEQAIAEMKERRDRSLRTPIARYAFGLALTYRPEPDLEEARQEIEAALGLNPQFAPAYLVRGWIDEMLELDEPDEGWLEKAVEDYAIAGRLNSEAIDRETEAEILLNSGNAKWRLADRTNDSGSFSFAYRDYLDRLAADLPFPSAETEQVFWERLGRAAIWERDWALSVTASREALRRVDRGGRPERRAQLWGNLALAYSEAGEPEYAANALEEFEREIARRGQESRLVVARRNLAVSRLSAAIERGDDALESALVALAESREALGKSGVPLGEHPVGAKMTVPDATRAPFGFEAQVELDLNLGLAADAHRAIGDHARARAIDQSRAQLLDAVISDHQPLTLGAGRERLGLLLRRARADCREGLGDRCRAEFQRSIELVEELSGAQALEKDLPALRVDRARVVALAAEEEALARARGAGFHVLGGLEGEIAGALEATEAIALSHTATGAALQPAGDWTRTSSSALVERGAVAIDAAQIHARLLHAQGLLTLVDAEIRAQPKTAALADVLRALDDGLAQRRVAKLLFQRAGDVASRAPGSWPAIAARHAIDALPEKGQPADSPLEAAAAAERVGAGALAIRLRLAALLARGWTGSAEVDSILASALPFEIGPGDPWVERCLSRTASAALAGGDREAAIDAIDRLLLLRGVTSRFAGPEQLDRESDRTFVAGLRAAAAELARAESAARAARGRSSEEATERVAAARARHLAARKAPATAAVRARVLAEPIGADKLPGALGARTALILPAEIEGELVVLFVDGSTTADDSYAVSSSGAPAAEIRARVARARALVASGAPVPPAEAQILEGVLLRPFEDRLRGKDTVIFADAMLNGPLPARALFPARPLAFAHASAPSAVLASRDAQRVGVEGTVVVSGTRESDATGVEGEIFSPDDALALGRRAREQEAASKAGDDAPRSLAARSKAERLAGRSQRLVIVEPEVQLEPSALERSVVVLRALEGAAQDDGAAAADHGDGADHAAAADRFRGELPLGALRLPARTLVLAQLAELDPGGAPLPAGAELRLDLALALRGLASTLLIPTSVPREIARRVLPRILALVPELGVARATLRVLAEEPAPAAAAITVVGAPGLDPQQEKAFAAEQLKEVMRVAGRLAKEGRFAEVAPVLEEALRLMRASGNTAAAPGAFQLLVVALGRTDQHARAADAQRELIAFLEEGGKSTEKRRIQARLELGSVLARAKDYDAAAATLAEAIKELKARDDRLALAGAWRRVAEVEGLRLDFAAAARALEAAVEAYERGGAFKDEKLSAEAIDALRRLGALYLNRLSDTARAKQAYERVLRDGHSREIEVGTILDLARVARRGGDFDEAATRAEAARTEAQSIKRSDLELEAVVEGANVAWYRGDYARGHELCRQSLTLGEANLKAARKDKLRIPRGEITRLVYALSVCGLLSMSTRDFAGAERSLLSAVRMARSIGNDAEEAAQYNNLGRVYLEFNLLERAIESFERAKEIDERLNDRFGLAYDLRNLGTALVMVEQYARAEETLERALSLSQAVRDENNQLRALFTLGELHRRRNDAPKAREHYRLALPLAERVMNKDLLWQAHRALGLIARTQGDLLAAKASLLRSVAVARTLSGRAAPSDFGPHRYAAFDDLLLLLLRDGRTAEAFEVAELARTLAQSDLLDDRRIRFGSELAPRLIARVRTTLSATAAEGARVELARIEPRIAERLRHADPERLAAVVPADALVVCYRATDEGLVIFTLDRSGLKGQLVPIPGAELEGLLTDYRRRLEERGDLTAVSARLGALLLAPIAGITEGKKTLVLVAQGSLRYLAFSALPFGEGGPLLIDRAVVLQALDVASAVSALAKPLPALGGGEIVAAGGAPPSESAREVPLAFALKELEIIREEYPRAGLLKGEGATKAAFLSALERGPAILHFSGHTRLGGSDPLAGELGTAGEPLKLYEVLSARGVPALVVLSACETMLGQEGGAAGEELLSLAQSFELAGARAVLATTTRVGDVAAAMVMKRFYRALHRQPVAEALRDAQQAVRRLEPHPAWWATFSLMVGSEPPARRRE